MAKALGGLAAGVWLTLGSMSLNAGQIDFLIGDVDYLGGGAGYTPLLNIPYFVGPFDHRTPAEKALILPDGRRYNEYFTDWASQSYGTQMTNPLFLFEFSPFTQVTSVTLSVGLGGVDVGKNHTLFLDGQVVSTIFPEQPSYFCGSDCPVNAEVFYVDPITGYATKRVFGYEPEFTWEIPLELWENFADGRAEFQLSFNRVNNGTFAGDYVAIDYVRFRVNTASTVPEPGSLALWALGLLGISLFRRRSSVRSG